ncbi:MAG TPA: hypothetical protein VIH85_00530 [Solirubrobacteraceae bacterium]
MRSRPGTSVWSASSFLLAPNFGVVMLLQGHVADLVAFGLTGCGMQN